MRHWILSTLISLAAVAAPMVAQASAFSGNTLEDIFTVKTIEGKEATLEGEAKSLKAGDTLYFVRSPFQFTVISVKGNRVNIALPDKSDLAVGQTLMRHATESVKHSIDTEKRLKQALEE